MCFAFVGGCSAGSVWFYLASIVVVVYWYLDSIYFDVLICCCV